MASSNIKPVKADMVLATFTVTLIFSSTFMINSMIVELGAQVSKH